MRSALFFAMLATTTRASLVAKDRDHYQKYWARSRDKGRCDAKHCEWIGGFDTIDVDCRIVIERDGLARGGRGPMLSLLWNNGRRKLSIDAQDASAIKQFETRPALCEYAPRNTTSDVALLMVANDPSYLFRMWGPFLNKLLYAIDAGLRPMLWLGDLPERLRTPTSEQCLNSSEMRYLADRSGAQARQARECSHRYIKIPATIAALAAPDIRGVYYVDMDAVARFPWSVDPNTLSEHRRRSSDVSFLVAHDGGLQWQVKGSRFYVRDSPKGRAFFANWFENRCTGSDQYPLWHTMLEFAALEGCVPYNGDIFGMRYSEAKHLKADDAPARLLLDCRTIDEACPSFPYARRNNTPPDLLDDLRPQGAGRGDRLRLQLANYALMIENACFATDGRCEYASDVSEFAALLGVAGRDRKLHPWNSTAARAPWEPIIGIGGAGLLGGPIAGLNNAKEALFQLCRRGRKISYPTLRASGVFLRLASVAAMASGPRATDAGAGTHASPTRRRCRRSPTRRSGTSITGTRTFPIIPVAAYLTWCGTGPRP